MKLWELLAGATPGNDPDDLPSGVKVTIEPSKLLLEGLDEFAGRAGITREAALAALAAGGLVTLRSIQALIPKDTLAPYVEGAKRACAETGQRLVRVEAVNGKVRAEVNVGPGRSVPGGRNVEVHEVLLGPEGPTQLERSIRTPF